ncbi:exopolysaccharide biosynthesis polyprenyl glycosylphosphotransferase [Maribacter sp. MAR_2009_72]|uniref:exopolysaccharide biosynthesis polyprenyl glycosylphosphotransferase n=1 Tax=Maribacter sp. MAR_2009_72 TaxID=1250050 RepID=UPI00119A7B48|nr:exopolysaccharide biosynthesis polyprenyl glycosylphosphotransferase [Maribacter sp. MAR_2009_72]TVZ16182.1 putative colanic acid biosynthesis UDP-glucose lipid carrier transferase [Maribacter sp. MAR_2009_72]
MIFKQGRYSGFITPLSYIMDLLVVNLFTNFLPINFQNPLLFHSYITIAWVVLSFKNEFYEVHRYSKVVALLRKLFTQFIFFFLILYAYIGFFKQPLMSRLALGQYFVLVFVGVAFFKFLSYVLLMQYRGLWKGNIRRVVIIGKNSKTDQLIQVFNEREEFGYEFVKQFDAKGKNFDIMSCFMFIVNNNIDEIYCSVSEMSNKKLNAFINFADNNLKTLKFLPDNKNIFSKKLKFEYYDYLPILSLRDIPLHNSVNAVLKRAFDIAFSLFVIFGILIWLGPLLALLITLESRGPVFFIQKRTGFDNREFQCFKFRSMAVNESSDLMQAGKNDMRVTKIGKFIRKTSIDELPQFYNVLFGNMSVVGPRPHMLKHTDEYASRVDKYMLRHFVKPGITGLAQIRGYRGEIEKESDIQNRIKFDIFYVENWSFFLDLKIIVQTVLNAIRGEEKAY